MARRDDEGQGRGMKERGAITNTAGSLKLLWVEEQGGIPAFVKHLNKPCIRLYFVLRLAAAPQASWATTSVCVTMSYEALRWDPQLLHGFQTCIYVWDGHRQLPLLHKQSASVVMLFLLSPYCHISPLLSPSPSQYHLTEHILHQVGVSQHSV